MRDVRDLICKLKRDECLGPTAATSSENLSEVSGMTVIYILEGIWKLRI